MKTEQQIRDEISEILDNQKQLVRQRRFKEAKYWDDILYYLRWVLGERD